MDKNQLKILKDVELFAGLSEASIEKALACLGKKTAKYKKGEIIISEGSPVKDLGIVLSGSVSVLKDDFSGTRAIIAQFHPSELFAEALACAQVEESPVTVEVVEDCEIIFIPFLRITNTCSNACGYHSKITMNMLKILARKNIFLNNKIEHAAKRSIREKLLSYFGELAANAGGGEFLIPFSKTALADYLFVDRSAMMRELSNMKKAGIINFSGNKFELRGSR